MSTYQRKIHFTAQELYETKDKAERCGLSFSSYVRSVLNGYKPKEKPDPEFYDLLKKLFEQVDEAGINGYQGECNDKIYDCLFEIEKKYLLPDKK